MDNLRQGGEFTKTLLGNARSSSLAATPRILSGNVDIDATVQTACLTAELAMKGVLAHLGATLDELKSWSHKLPKLAEALIERKRTATDERLLKLVSQFPHAVFVDLSTRQRQASQVHPELVRRSNVR